MTHSKAFTPEATAKRRAGHLAVRINRHGQNIDKKQARERVYSAKRYAASKQSGKCSGCRFRQPDPGYSTCERCRKRQRRYKLKFRRSMTPLTQAQTCRTCGEHGHNAMSCIIRPDRCRCGLRLPCNSCIPSIDYYASSRKGDSAGALR